MNELYSKSANSSPSSLIRESVPRFGCWGLNYIQDQVSSLDQIKVS